MNTLKYFEDYSLKRDAACPAIAFSDGGRLAKRAVYGWTLGRRPSENGSLNANEKDQKKYPV
jgi:hypothetical protein